MIKIDIKPLSVNCAWQGRRYKTKKYREYENSLLFLMPRFKVAKGKLKVSFVFGISDKSDLDNPIKCLIDIMQVKYNFDDKDILILNVEKVIVKTGREFIEYNIENL